MLHIAVYGTSKWSDLLASLLEKEYSDVVEQAGGERLSIDYRVQLSADTAKGELSVKEFANLYQTGVLAAIVVPKEYFNQYDLIIHTLLRYGVEPDGIFTGIRLDMNREKMVSVIENLICPYLSDSYLGYLEFHAADHCNLNCKYCTHYSPLVKNPVFPDFETFEKDLQQLKKYVFDIGTIRIVGGEPLLNPELPKYIRAARALYPASIIDVVTNGLRIEKINDELVQAMKECMAFFHISLYQPLESRLSDIKNFLYQKGIVYTISPLNDVFLKTQTLERQENEDYFYSCFQGTCTCIQNGKLAPCYAPFTTKYFNEAFSQNLPTEEGIDLYDSELNLPVLKGSLLIPMERCLYCFGGIPEQWSVIGKNSRMEDWV